LAVATARPARRWQGKGAGCGEFWTCGPRGIRQQDANAGGATLGASPGEGNATAGVADSRCVSRVPTVTIGRAVSPGPGRQPQRQYARGHARCCPRRQADRRHAAAEGRCCASAGSAASAETFGVLLKRLIEGKQRADFDSVCKALYGVEVSAKDAGV